MTDKLKSALISYLKSQGRVADPDTTISVDFYVELGNCSCDASTALLEISYYEEGKSWRTDYGINGYDVEDFLTFLVEGDSE